MKLRENMYVPKHFETTEREGILAFIKATMYD
jgi:predicted FMN-binding regulatory protein PaiB